MDLHKEHSKAAQIKMDEYDFQRQVRALKERVSEMSMRYSFPNPMSERMLSHQLDGLKSQLGAMQERLTQYGGQSPAIPSPSLPETFNIESRDPYETQNHFSLPSGPLFWQLFENLRTDIRSIDSRVATLESSVSDLEDRVDSLDPDRFTPPSSTSNSDFEGFHNAGHNVSYFGNTKSKDYVPELSSESSCLVTTRRPQDRVNANNFSPEWQPGPSHAQVQTPSMHQGYRDTHFRHPSGLHGLTGVELCNMRQHNENLEQHDDNTYNVVERLTSQIQMPPNSPVNGSTKTKGNPPEQDQLLGLFQKLEDTLECLCGIDAIKLNGYETMGTTGLTLSKADILRTAQATLAHLSHGKLHQAVWNGLTDQHFDELLYVARDPDALVNATFMSDVFGRDEVCPEPSGKCDAHSVIECIRCRKEWKKKNVQDSIRRLARAAAMHADGKDNRKGDDCLTGSKLGTPMKAAVELEQNRLRPVNREQLEGLAFRDREIARLDEQLRTAQERLRVSEESLNDERVLLLQTRQERDDLKHSNTELTTRIYDLEEDAYDYNGRLLAKEKQLGDLHDLIEQKNRALEIWGQSWAQLRESSERENARSRDHERLITEERDRNECAMERIIQSHQKEMKSLQEFCEQKDGVICKQEQIISRGRKLLEEREREITLLHRDFRAIKDDKEHATRNADRMARLLQERTADLTDLKRHYEHKERDRVRSSVDKEEKYTDAVEQQDIMDARDRRTPAVTFLTGVSQMPSGVLHTKDKVRSERSDNTSENRPDKGSNSRRRWPQQGWRPRQNYSGDERSIRRMYNVQNGETSIARPTQPDATFQPPLPAPVMRVRRTESEADLRNSSRNTNAIPARKSLSKHKSMHEMQAYVESDNGSGGELGGEV